MPFRAKLSNRVQWQLSHLRPDERARIIDCSRALQLNPYRDIEARVTLVWPPERVYHDAYRCGDWAIAYEFEDENTLLIEAIRNLFY